MEMKPPNNKIQFITTTTVATDKDHKLDPGMVKYCFEIVIGDHRFTTPWYMDKPDEIKQKKQDMHDMIWESFGSPLFQIHIND
jgi:hypothetical protein